MPIITESNTITNDTHLDEVPYKSTMNDGKSQWVKSPLWTKG